MWIETYTPKWQASVVELGDRVFGQGYFSRPSEVAAEARALILLSLEEDMLCGFVQGRVLPKKELADFLKYRLDPLPDDIAAADAKGVLGVIHAVAVAPEKRAQGVGTKLLHTMHDALVGMGADKLIVTFKRGPSATQVDGIMTKQGFEVWTRLPSYWQARCDAGEFRCVDRSERCSCEAVFYRKASLSSGIPSTLVYLVRPSRMAL